MESDLKCCFLCLDIILSYKSDKKPDHYPVVFETCQNYMKNETQDKQNPPHTGTRKRTTDKKIKSPIDLPSLCEHCLTSAEKLWKMDLELEYLKKRMQDFITEFKLDISRRAYSAIKTEKLSDDNLSWKHGDLNSSNIIHIQIKEERDPLEMDEDYEDTTPYCPNPNMKDIEGNNVPPTIDESGNDQVGKGMPKKRKNKTKKMFVEDSKKPKRPRSRSVKESVTLDRKNETDIDKVVKDLPKSSDGFKKLVKGYQCAECTTLFETADQLICTICHTKKNESNEGVRKNFKKFNLKSTRSNQNSRHGDSREKKTRFPCNFCDMTFSQKSRLQAHLVNVHLSSEVDGSETNTCTVCDIVYDDAELYMYHMQVKHKCT